MQSGNREYIGRNEFWTPSTIGITQSLIDTSINKIELKDNTADLFTVENNKLKSNIQMICDDPTDNEDIVNKKYVDDKDNEVQLNMSSKFITPSQANRMFASKDDIPIITFSKFYALTTEVSSYNYEYKNITSYKAIIEISIPSTINGNVIFVNVNFRVGPNSTNNSFLDKLACTLNSDSTTGNVIKATFNGATARGVLFTNGIELYKFSLNQIFTDLPTSSRKVYLHFFYVENVSYEVEPSIVLPTTSENPNLEVTVVGFNFI